MNSNKIVPTLNSNKPANFKIVHPVNSSKPVCPANSSKPVQTVDGVSVTSNKPLRLINFSKPSRPYILWVSVKFGNPVGVNVFALLTFVSLCRLLKTCNFHLDFIVFCTCTNTNVFNRITYI